MTVNELEQSVAQIRESCDAIRTAVSRKIVGQSKVIDQMLVAVYAGLDAGGYNGNRNHSR